MSLHRPWIAAWLLGSLLLLVPALVNGFPFMFPDSGDYLVFTPQPYRSPFYGLFIFFFHLNTFVWAPVVAQALIAGHLVRLLTAKLAPAAGARGYLAVMVFLAASSSLPFFAGWIMADFFTAVVFLTLFLMAFYFSEFPRRLRVYLFLLCCVAISAHVSHVYMAAGMLPVAAALLLRDGRALGAVGRRLAVLAGPVALTIAATLLYNALILGVPSLSPAGGGFYMARLIEQGPGRRYLEEACATEDYAICRYLDRLPRTAADLLWRSGLYDELGGFVAMRPEAEAIAEGTIRAYPWAVASSTARSFLAALASVDPVDAFGGWVARIPSLPPLIGAKFGPAAEAAFVGSLQARGELPRDAIGAFHAALFPAFAALLLAGAAVYHRRGERAPVSLAAFVACAYVGNALMCATLSGVHDRYQARLSWLILLAVALMALRALAAARSGSPAPAAAAFPERG